MIGIQDGQKFLSVGSISFKYDRESETYTIMFDDKPYKKNMALIRSEEALKRETLNAITTEGAIFIIEDFFLNNTREMESSMLLDDMPTYASASYAELFDSVVSKNDTEIKTLFTGDYRNPSFDDLNDNDRLSLSFSKSDLSKIQSIKVKDNYPELRKCLDIMDKKIDKASEYVAYKAIKGISKLMGV